MKFLFLFENKILGVLYLEKIFLKSIFVVFLVFWDLSGNFLIYREYVFIYNRIYLFFFFVLYKGFRMFMCYFLNFFAGGNVCIGGFVGLKSRFVCW